MSYGIGICPSCGGEVSVYEGYGGKCPNCGAWVSAGTCDSIAEEIACENEMDRLERMRHDRLMEKVKDAEAKGTLKIVTYYEEPDYDRTYRYRNEFKNLKEAQRSFYHEIYFYDGDKKIEVNDDEL